MKVFVTLCTYRQGDDLSVYATAEQAEQARQAFALAWWEQEIGKPLPEAEPSVIADMYFEAMYVRGELWIMEEATVQGLGKDPTVPSGTKRVPSGTKRVRSWVEDSQ